MVDTIIVAVYNIILLAGTAYLVQFHDWTPWWFLLTLLILGSRSRSDNK